MRPVRIESEGIGVEMGSDIASTTRIRVDQPGASNVATLLDDVE